MKYKRILFIILSTLFLVTSFAVLIITPTRADSGWDVSYDSGGSSSSGSSWSSSDYSSSSGSSEPMGPLGIAITIIILAIVTGFTAFFILAMIISGIKDKKERKRKRKKMLKNIEEMVNDGRLDGEFVGLNGLGIENQIINEAFKIYKDVQIAWMNFDYDTLEWNLTDELFNNYKMLLETLKLKGEKNVMSDIRLTGGEVTNIKNVDGKQTIYLRLSVKMRDYVINETTGKVVRGSKETRNVNYKITLVKTNKELTKCPNCGAKLTRKNHQKCSHCKSVITAKTTRYVMSKKEIKWR